MRPHKPISRFSSLPEANLLLTKSFHSRLAFLSLAPRESVCNRGLVCHVWPTAAVSQGACALAMVLSLWMRVKRSLFFASADLSAHMSAWNKWIREQYSLRQWHATSLLHHTGLISWQFTGFRAMRKQQRTMVM